MATAKTQINFPDEKKNSLRTGFEPARAGPIGFQVQLLNHSDTAAVIKCLAKVGFSSLFLKFRSCLAYATRQALNN